jgi:hypothetical protein
VPVKNNKIAFVFPHTNQFKLIKPKNQFLSFDAIRFYGIINGERMNKLIKLFLIFIILPIYSAGAAVQIKKAAPVATNTSATAGTEGAASLVPSLIGLVSGVMEMNAKQKALTADCIPSSAEMNFVDNTIKEWAKTGQTTAKNVEAVLKRLPCAAADNGYATDVMVTGASAGLAPCFNNFKGSGNDGMVWDGFPKTGKGTYCKSGAYSCTGSDLVTLSDTYDLFNLIDFGPADYTPAEATMAAKLLNKVETCSTSKLNQKKKALWGEFLVNTASSLGQKTDTGNIMQTVGSISSKGGIGALGSLGSIATQFMNK